MVAYTAEDACSPAASTDAPLEAVFRPSGSATASLIGPLPLLLRLTPGWMALFTANASTNTLVETGVAVAGSAARAAKLAGWIRVFMG